MGLTSFLQAKSLERYCDVILGCPIQVSTAYPLRF